METRQLYGIGDRAMEQKGPEERMILGELEITDPVLLI